MAVGLLLTTADGHLTCVGLDCLGITLNAEGAGVFALGLAWLVCEMRGSRVVVHEQIMPALL